MSKIVLPYEPQYTGHRELEKRCEATKEWLQRREFELDEESPPLLGASQSILTNDSIPR